MKNLFKHTFLLLTLSLTLMVGANDVHGVSFGLSPVEEEHKANWRYAETINPGESFTSSVRVRNLEDTPVSFGLQAVDASTNAQGYIVLKSVGKTVGTWITFDQDMVSLDAHGFTDVGFTIRVPEYATPGDYAGGIVAFPTSITNEDGTVSGSSVGTRVGLKAFVSIPGDRSVSLQLDKFEHDVAENEDHVFRLGLSNGGNTHVKVEGELELSPRFGEVTVLKVNLGQITSGQKSFPVIRWQNSDFYNDVVAKLTLRYEEISYGLSDRPIQKEKIERQLTFFIFDSTKAVAISISFLLVLFVILFFIIRRRKEYSNAIAYQVGEGETLDSLAQLFGTDAKKIIRVNDLEFPYSIHSDQVIKIPLSDQKLQEVRDHPEHFNLHADQGQ